MADPRRKAVRLFLYNSWAGGLVEAEAGLAQVPNIDIRRWVSNPQDPKMLQMARLDCDWHWECTRCLSHLRLSHQESRSARVLGRTGFSELLALKPPADESWWLVFYGQQPGALGTLLGKVAKMLTKNGIQIAYYAFDEASRTLGNFLELAPCLRLLIHDEEPLAEPARKALPPACTTLCRSWVANLLPHASPFCETPEKRLLFLGSEMGLTPHRQRQIAFLKERFKDRFVAIHDHSLPVGERLGLSRFKASLCPEGRKFGSPAMASNHTDRPFWSGCLGMVPVSEDSQRGGRLEALRREGLLLRYRHGDLKELASACEEALEMSDEARRRIYEHYNQKETVGVVLAEQLQRAEEAPSASTT